MLYGTKDLRKYFGVPANYHYHRGMSNKYCLKTVFIMGDYKVEYDTYSERFTVFQVKPLTVVKYTYSLEEVLRFFKKS